MNRKMMARYFIFAVLIASAALSFAGQQGLPIGGRLVDHQHTTYGDGGILQGLSPVGNFYIFGNNAGNIQISTSITGRLFAWKPASGTFIAGESTDDSFYVNNLGKYSWIGGYNSSSPGDYSLAFGTYAKNNRAASMLLGYYLKNNAGNSVMIGSGPGFGPQPYAVNDDTGSIKFFPFTTTSETRPMLNLKRDGTGEFVGVLNFTSTPTLNGIELSTAVTTDNSKVLKTGDTMTGPLTLAGVGITASSVTVTGQIGANNSSGAQAIFKGYSAYDGSFSYDGEIRIGGESTYQGKIQYGIPGTTADLVIDNTYDSTDSKILLRLRTNGTAVNAITATGNGNVGIGTTGPGAKLAITNGDSASDIQAFSLIQNDPDNYSMYVDALTYGAIFRSRTADFTALSSIGNFSVTSGSATISGPLSVGTMPEYADNAAALAGGLTAGAFYRTGDDLKVVH